MKLDPYIGDVRVECAFSTAPDDLAPAFVDISDYVAVQPGISITRGRMDEYAVVQPGTCRLSLDNTLGYFTAGYTGSPWYPNVKIRKKIRVTVRDMTIAGNLLSIEDATFEGGTVGDWIASPSTGAPPALSNSTAHAHSGTKSLLIVWATGIGYADLTLTGLVIGRQYTLSTWVFVPSAPSVFLQIKGTGNYGAGSATGAFSRISLTFTATATSETVQVAPGSPPTSGQSVYVDDVQLDEGPNVQTFTTTPPVISYRYTGYVDEWPTEWPGGGDYSLVQVTATDRFKRIGGSGSGLTTGAGIASGTHGGGGGSGKGTGLSAFRSIIEMEYLSDSPFAYYTLAEPAASVLAGDTSGNGCGSLAIAQAGSGGTLTFGSATGPSTDALTALSLAPVNTTNGKYLTGDFGAQNSTNSNGMTIEVFFSTSTAGDQSMVSIYYVTKQADWLQLGITAAGKLKGNIWTGSAITSAATVTDGLTHHAAFKLVFDPAAGGTITTTLYLDGAIAGTTTTSFPAIFPFAGMQIGYTPLSFGTPGAYTGTLAHAACYAIALSDARVADHATAGLTGFSGERSDQRIARYARYAKIPPSEQVLEVGSSTSIAFVDVTGQAPLTAMQTIEATESGLLLIDGLGRLAFQGRNHRYNTTSVLTLAGEDIDPSAKFIENDAYLINDVSASRPNGITFRAINQQSVTDYGQAQINPSLITTSDNEVVDAANWKANQTAVPTSRLPNLTVNILTNPAIAAAVLALDISSRITIGTLPQYAPMTSGDVFIEGLTETITDQEYKLAFNTSPASQSSVWQLDSAIYSQLDSTTRLAY